jgi:hypothetical protein
MTLLSDRRSVTYLLCFSRSSRVHRSASISARRCVDAGMSDQERIACLERKIQTKDEVLAELMGRACDPKKTLREL